MNKRNLLKGLFAALVVGLVVVGCGRQDNDRLAISIAARNPIVGGSVDSTGETTGQDPREPQLYQFYVIVSNHAKRIERDAFHDRPLGLVIGGAARIFDVEAVPSRHQSMVPDAVTVVDNEVRIAPFSLQRNGSFVVQFKVASEPELDHMPTILGVLAEIDGVRVIRLSKESS